MDANHFLRQRVTGRHLHRTSETDWHSADTPRRRLPSRIGQAPQPARRPSTMRQTLERRRAARTRSPYATPKGFARTRRRSSQPRPGDTYRPR